MDIDYENFMETLRQRLITVTDYRDEFICFKKEEEYPPTKGDRLFLKRPQQNGVYEVCALHIRELYEEFVKGLTMDEIVREVTEHLSAIARSECFKKVRNLEEYDRVKQDLFIRLLNLKKNQEELKEAVYRTIGDIALVLYARVGEMDGCFASIKIRNHILKKWERNPEKVFETALSNTGLISPPRFYLWEKLLYMSGYDGESFMDAGKEFPIKRDELGNCLSTTLRTNGAVAVFLPGVAEKIGHLMKSGFYMVFTSVHEVMIHNDQCVDPEDLRHVLKETVRETTPEEDFLSFYIYHYNRDTREFTYC